MYPLRMQAWEAGGGNVEHPYDVGDIIVASRNLSDQQIDKIFLECSITNLSAGNWVELPMNDAGNSYLDAEQYLSIEFRTKYETNPDPVRYTSFDDIFISVTVR
jgi:hypothetical protein